MSRLNLTNEVPETEDNLEELIPMYAFNKGELDSYKKLCDDQNAKIKKAMNELHLDELDAGGYTAKITIQHRESVNEDKLLAVMKMFELPCVKTIEVVDMDALEAYLYNNSDKLPEGLAEKLSACKTTNEVVTLKVGVTKQKKVKSDG